MEKIEDYEWKLVLGFLYTDSSTCWSLTSWIETTVGPGCFGPNGTFAF